MTLVDTSAWIDFFRGRAPLSDRVDDLLATGRVALCGPVVTELRRGLRVSERTKILGLLAGCRMLDDPAALWEEAGELGFTLGRRGANVKSIDLLIAVYALAHGVELLSKDGDFALMRRAGIPLLLG